MKYQIKDELKKMSDSKYKEFQSKICPGTNNILGIRMPELRKYAKKLSKEYSLDSLLKVLDDEYCEEVMLQGMVIGLQTKEDWNTIKKEIKWFIQKINNWAVCDTFCAGLKITKKVKNEMWELVQESLKSSKEFEIRFAVVMILDYFIEEEYLKRDFEIFDQIKNKEYYVKMAIAWAVSICLIKFYDQTIQYLTNNVMLDDWTYNKAIQKAIESYRITNQQKEQLRKMKRK